MPLYITLWFVELSSFKFSGITRFIILLKNQLQIRFTTQIYPFLQNRSRQKWEEEKDKFINYTWMRAGNCRCLGFNEWRIAYVKMKMCLNVCQIMDLPSYWPTSNFTTSLATSTKCFQVDKHLSVVQALSLGLQFKLVEYYIHKTLNLRLIW